MLVRDETPAVWFLEQDSVGPDGVARRRDGIVASLRAEPYANHVVLPHERTHAAALEGRLRLLRATRTQLEPIFLLYDGPDPPARPDEEPDIDVEGTRLWRLEGDLGVAEFFADRELLIADGHHRYEAALAVRGRGRRRSAARRPRLDRRPRARGLPDPPRLHGKARHRPGRRRGRLARGRARGRSSTEPAGAPAAVFVAQR